MAQGLVNGVLNETWAHLFCSYIYIYIYKEKKNIEEADWQWSGPLGKKAYLPLKPLPLKNHSFHTDINNLNQTFVSKYPLWKKSSNTLNSSL